MPQIISATKARDEFGEILNRVFYHGEEFVVEKQGRPAALITRVKKTESAEDLSFSTNKAQPAVFKPSIISLGGMVNQISKITPENAVNLRNWMETHYAKR